MSPEPLNAFAGPVPGSDAPGRSVEGEIAADLARRVLFILPLGLILGAATAGTRGATSVMIAAAVVIANFALSASIVTRAARISAVAMAGAAMFGLLFRLAVIVGVMLALRNMSWVSPTALGISLIVLHLASLVWETRYISGSLAFPGLKPKKKD